MAHICTAAKRNLRLAMLTDRKEKLCRQADNTAGSAKLKKPSSCLKLEKFSDNQLSQSEVERRNAGIYHVLLGYFKVAIIVSGNKAASTSQSAATIRSHILLI